MHQIRSSSPCPSFSSHRQFRAYPVVFEVDHLKKEKIKSVQSVCVRTLFQCVRIGINQATPRGGSNAISGPKMFGSETLLQKPKHDRYGLDRERLSPTVPPTASYRGLREAVAFRDGKIEFLHIEPRLP